MAVKESRSVFVYNEDNLKKLLVFCELCAQFFNSEYLGLQLTYHTVLRTAHMKVLFFSTCQQISSNLQSYLKLDLKLQPSAFTSHLPLGCRPIEKQLCNTSSHFFEFCQINLIEFQTVQISGHVRSWQANECQYHHYLWSQVIN